MTPPSWVAILRGTSQVWMPLLLLLVVLATNIHSADSLRHEMAGTELANHSNNTASQALAELMPSRDGISSTAFYLGLYLGTCAGSSTSKSSTAPSSMTTFNTWEKGAYQYAAGVPFSLSQGPLTLTANFDPGVPCTRECEVAVQLKRPGIDLESSAFELCLMVQATTEDLSCGFGDTATTHHGLVLARVTTINKREDALLEDISICIYVSRKSVGSGQIMIRQIILHSDLPSGSSLLNALALTQAQQDQRTYMPHQAVKLASTADNDPGSFFSHLYDIAVHAETTRDRESMMQEACRLSLPIISAELQLADASSLTHLYCQLYNRNEAGAPNIYAENGPLDGLQQNCSTRAENKHLLKLCKLVDDLKSDKAILEKRARTLRAALPAVFQTTKASRAEVVLVLGAGPIGLLQALAASLTGAQVTVMDGRGEFTRLNAMKAHTYIQSAKFFHLNKVRDFESYTEDGFLSASNAQRLLARAAAAYGVQVHLQREFLAYCPPEADQRLWGSSFKRWYAVFTKQPDEDFDSLEPTGRIRARSQGSYADWFKQVCENREPGLLEKLVRVEFDVLIGAEGIRSPSRDQAAQVAGIRLSSNSTHKEITSGWPSRVRGVFNETYAMMLWRRVSDVLPMHGAVLAWRSKGDDRCVHEIRRGISYFSYTFPYQGNDIEGYCWSGYILKDKMYRDLAEQRKQGGQVQLATAMMQQLLRPSPLSPHPDKQLTIHDVIFDQKHGPHAAIFDVPMMRTDEPLALQVSSGGVHMALLLAGDAAITPWFPRSIGLNAGASRALEPFKEQRLGPDGRARSKSEYLKDTAEAERQKTLLGWEQLPKADVEVRLVRGIGRQDLDGKGFTKEGLRVALQTRGIHLSYANFHDIWNAFPKLMGDIRKTKCCWESSETILAKSWRQLEPAPVPEVRREDKIGGVAVTHADVVSMGMDESYWQMLPHFPERRLSEPTPENAAGLLLRCIRPETRGLETCRTRLHGLRSDLLYAIDEQMDYQVLAIKSLLSRCAASHAIFFPMTAMVTGLVVVMARV